MTAAKTLLVMDVDTGIDDALALLLALRAPEAEVLAIGTVAGNIEADQADVNTLKVLDIVGATHVPVAVGIGKGLFRPLATVPYIHGVDGMGDAGYPAPSGRPTGEHAVDQLVRLARERPGEITLCAVGPLSNIGMALVREPDLPRLLKNVVIMGGAADPVGNVTAVAEANIWHDPEAARLVFEADWPTPLTMVGLDVTMRTLLRRPHIDELRNAASPVARFAGAIINFYVDRYTELLGEEACAMHDPLALGIALDRTLMTRVAPLDVEIETASPFAFGMTVVDRRPLLYPGYPKAQRPADVAIEVDSDRFIARMMETLLRQA